MNKSVLGMLGFLVIMPAIPGGPVSLSYSQTSPVGSWAGVIRDNQRNIVVKLKVTGLEPGAESGEMRWGTPRTCSLHTEYSGMRDTQFTFNISQTNGGWCDFYREGTLFIQFDNNNPESLRFMLGDKHGGRTVEGTMAPASASEKALVPRAENRS